MRLGDLDALKEKFDDYIKANPNISGVFELGKFIIDNAPTVELRDVFDEGYEAGKAVGRKVCDSCKIYKRPQGEWIPLFAHNIYKCSECERTIGLTTDETLSDYPFCHCGADMRGKEGDNDGANNT